MKIILTPARDSVLAGFAFDLTNLIRTNPDTYWALSQGTILPNLRNGMAKQAIQHGFKYLLFIDSDMRFPADTFERLIKHNLPIVGANCKQRTQDEFTARTKGQFLSSKGRKGLEAVDTLGMGVTLIKSEVFKKLPEPWFSTFFDGTKHVGEDVFFCGEARKAGYEIMVDHDLSQEIKHAGLQEFGIQ